MIAAYGDPRDTKFLQPRNDENVDKHDVELSESEDTDELISENQDTIRDNS